MIYWLQARLLKVEENDMYAAGQHFAYTNALAIILEVCTSEYAPDDEHDKTN